MKKTENVFKEFNSDKDDVIKDKHKNKISEKNWIRIKSQQAKEKKSKYGRLLKLNIFNIQTILNIKCCHYRRKKYKKNFLRRCKESRRANKEQLILNKKGILSLVKWK